MLNICGLDTGRLFPVGGAPEHIQALFLFKKYITVSFQRWFTVVQRLSLTLSLSRDSEENTDARVCLSTRLKTVKFDDRRSPSVFN